MTARRRRGAAPWSGRSSSARRGGAGDRGAAVVDFVLVGGLVTVLFVAIVQLTLVLHVRNVLIDCAAQGARYAAAAGREPAEGVGRTVELATAELSAAYAGDVTAARARVGGVDVVEVTVRAPMPVVGLLGPGGVLVVHGHAMVERP